MDRTVAEEIARELCGKLGLLFVGFAGQGSFKFVFETESEVGTRLALKLLNQKMSDARSRREIEAMQTCRCDNIGQLLDLGTEIVGGKKVSYLLEEFFSSGSLEDEIQAGGGTLTLERVISVGEGIIQALVQLEELNLVHRDIKPANIMLREDGTAVLVDFGLVRYLDKESLTATWAMQGPGSPFYAAPEQLSNSKQLIDHRTDQFGLGITLWYACTGMHPYCHTQEEAPLEVVERVATYGALSGEVVQQIQSKLAPIEKMIGGWPIERFLTSQQLLEQWIKLES